MASAERLQQLRNHWQCQHEMVHLTTALRYLLDIFTFTLSLTYTPSSFPGTQGGMGSAMQLLCLT
jgi:hypothetical protein